MSEVAAVEDPVTWGTRVICSLSAYQFTMEAEMVMPKMATAKKVVRQLRTRNEGISCKQTSKAFQLEQMTHARDGKHLSRKCKCLLFNRTGRVVLDWNKDNMATKIKKDGEDTVKGRNNIYEELMAGGLTTIRSAS